MRSDVTKARNSSGLEPARPLRGGLGTDDRLVPPRAGEVRLAVLCLRSGGSCSMGGHEVAQWSSSQE